VGWLESEVEGWITTQVSRRLSQPGERGPLPIARRQAQDRPGTSRARSRSSPPAASASPPSTRPSPTPSVPSRTPRRSIRPRCSGLKALGYL